MNNSSGKLPRQDSSHLPKTAKEFSRYAFWHYTRIDNAEKIIRNKCFKVNCMANMNDMEEIQRLWKERYDIYSLCFCNSDTEKIPMWYLYSGIEGKGAAIGLTPGIMMKFITSIQTVKVIDGENLSQALTRGKDFDLQFGWVYYQDQNDPKRYFYKNNWYAEKDWKRFQKHNYFIKMYPWEYEREYRIIFVNKTGSLIKRIEVDIPDHVLAHMKILLGPEHLQASISQRIAQYPSLETSCYQRIDSSKLSINMDLISRNRNTIWEYVRREAEKNGVTKEAETVLAAFSASSDKRR